MKSKFETLAHSALFAVWMHEAVATTSNEDMDDTRESIESQVIAMTENQAKIEFMNMTMSESDLEDITDNAMDNIECGGRYEFNYEVEQEIDRLMLIEYDKM